MRGAATCAATLLAVAMSSYSSCTLSVPLILCRTRSACTTAALSGTACMASTHWCDGILIQRMYTDHPVPGSGQSRGSPARGGRARRGCWGSQEAAGCQRGAQLLERLPAPQTGASPTRGFWMCLRPAPCSSVSTQQRSQSEVGHTASDSATLHSTMTEAWHLAQRRKVGPHGCCQWLTNAAIGQGLCLPEQLQS